MSSTTSWSASQLASLRPGESVDFGALDDGRPVQLHAIGDGGPVARLIDYGAAIQGVRVPFSDGPDEVVLGLPDAASYEHATGYLGAVVGRYANRIAGAHFTLDGVDYQLEANEPPNTLHGGSRSFAYQLWQLVDHTPTTAEFHLTSPDGESGFPGEVSAKALYTALPDGLRLELSATTTKDTVLGLTSHAYLQLSSSAMNRCDDLVMTIPADHYLPIGQGSIPRDGLEPVDGTPFDFRSPALIGEALRSPHDQIGQAGGIDHSFDVTGEGMRMLVRLENPQLGRRIEVHSDRPAVQVYTANDMDGHMMDPSGRRLRQGAGLAVEPQVHPDTPNRPQLGSAVVRADQTWTATIEWHASEVGSS